MTPAAKSVNRQMSHRWECFFKDLNVLDPECVHSYRQQERRSSNSRNRLRTIRFDKSGFVAHMIRTSVDWKSSAVWEPLEGRRSETAKQLTFDNVEGPGATMYHSGFTRRINVVNKPFFRRC